VRRFSAAFIAALFAVGLLAPASLAAPSPAAVPKVVFIVGPAGAATSGYRTEARAAAALARRYTPDVIELYSPDATWPAVKAALAGASLVVYMGHGNGWPSIYRDSLYPPSEDGFGLNPAPGGNDDTHQYFGEASIAAQVKLATNAVVMLNHLCYASGNSEPQLPEGSLDQARQRVDNYAAGFIHAGASAVIAEAWSSPSYMVRAILGGGKSIQSAWQNAPSANDHRLAFASVRSPGYIAQMDTETSTSGFTRSIVMKAGLAPKDVVAGARGSAAAGAADALLPAAPSLLATGIQLKAPDITGLPAAGTAGHVDVAFKIKNRKALPKGLEASVRWDPIQVAITPTDPTSEVTATAPAADAVASASSDGDTATPVPSAAPSSAPVRAQRPVAADPVAAGTATKPAAQPDVMPRVEPPADPLDLVVPEQLGDVVSPAAVKIGKTTLSVPVTFPTAPGRYRLTVTFHDADGVAYDAASQALIPSLSVRVTGDFDGAIQAAPTAELPAGTDAALDLRVVNLGRTAWGHAAIASSANLGPSAQAQAANVVGRWIPLSAGAALPNDPAAQVVGTALPIGLKPGVSVDASVALTTPTAPGQYLLLLDIVTPERGSLVASGADPTLIRITVLAPTTAP
jgi:hypothetical protein